MSEGTPRNTSSRQVIYIHGIGKQDPPGKLKVRYDKALFRRDVGELTRLAYWSDIRHDIAAEDMTSAQAFDPFRNHDPDAISKEERAFMRRFADQLLDNADRAAETDLEAKVIPIGRLRRAVTSATTRLLIRDTAAYFYNQEQRQQMQARLRDLLNAGPPPKVLIAHSQGTIIAYDVLREEAFEKYRIPLLITLGSPLGVQEVQDHIAKPLQKPAGVDVWYNVADRLDPVSLDTNLVNDFTPEGQDERAVVDVRVVNPDRRWTSLIGAHSATGYLSTEAVRDRVEQVTGAAGFGPVSDFVIARDVAADLADPAETNHVLFELSEDAPGGTLDEKREYIVSALIEIQKHKTTSLPEDDDASKKKSNPAWTKAIVAAATGDIGGFLTSAAWGALVTHLESKSKQAGTQRILDGKPPRRGPGSRITSLKRFVAAELSAYEIDLLTMAQPGLKFTRVWRNSVKQALLVESSQTIHATPARQSYGAMGKGITWAVLDSGINPRHDHFFASEDESNTDRWGGRWFDCTQPGGPKENAGIDRYGHGTHVAGIICGWSKTRTTADLKGIAPLADINSYKVLDDNGAGRDDYIIKALDHIASRNDNSPSLVVHGINLSLGGPFDPTVFGCGYSPLCRELRRLWQQGVVVCVAAGNEGRAVIEGLNSTHTLNPSLSIGDPANLEECIAVGSVHKSRPVTYGVSYFSSRGPTADGRVKPDVVAPGERIVSASHRFDRKEKNGEPRYVEMSGTSMACPHVSGLIAAFLSVRREYIGRPDMVKQRLLEACTDLKRDRYHQGAGLPNLMKMLVSA